LSPCRILHTRPGKLLMGLGWTVPYGPLRLSLMAEPCTFAPLSFSRPMTVAVTPPPTLANLGPEVSAILARLPQSQKKS
jgi:hypothetical protein